MRWFIAWLLLFALPNGWRSAAFAGDADNAASKAGDAGVRAVIARSLPFLESKGVAWIAERGCVSCHQTAFLVWTHNEARRRGFAVNPEKLDAWNAWTVLNVLMTEQNGTRTGAETLSQILLGRDAQSWLVRNPTVGTRSVEPYENVVKDLLACQTPEGNWTAAGQSRNPPDVPTGWALIALAARDRAAKSMGDGAPDLLKLVKDNTDAAAKARASATAWLDRTPPEMSKDLTERAVVRLLMESMGIGKGQADQRLRDLLARQNPDGGWAVNPKLERGSDAFATGMALYAISAAATQPTSRPAATDEAIAKAQAYLHDSQQTDGSWKVATESFHPRTGKPRDARTDDVYTYWGTGWATIGLLHTLQSTAPLAP